MKKTKNLFFIALLFFTFSVLSQTSGTTDKKESLKSIKNTEKRAAGMVQPNAAKPVESSGPGFQLDENDPYQGRKEEFLSLLTVKELPSDFPKYKKSFGVGGYNALLDEFLATHKNIVTESVKRKLEFQGK